MPSTTTTPVLMRLEHELIKQMDEMVMERGYSSRSALAREALKIGLESMKSDSKGLTPVSVQIPHQPSEIAAIGDVDPIFKTFAQAVLESARRCRTGRFGEDRLFINHAWRQYKKDLGMKMSLEDFKQKLLEANRGRYLSLVCADMASMLDQADVKESEIHYLSATFHFICF